MPVGGFEMEIEPTKQYLLRRQSKKLLQRLIFLQQSIQFGMKLDIDLTQESTSNNLPNQAEDKVFPAFNKICAADVDNMSKTFCRVDNEIVVFDHLELTEFLAASGFIENTFINCLGSTRH